MGYPAAAPANTVSSAVAAIEAGADMVEIDVSLTSDGHAIAIHGPRLEQSTDGYGPIRRVDLAAIRELNAKQAGDVVPGARVPEVREIVEAVPSGAFNFDLKTGRAIPAILELIDREALHDRCVISGATATRVGRLRRARPGVALLLNLNRMDKALARTRIGARWLSFRYRRLLRADEVVALNISHRFVNQELVHRVHALGAEVWAYTADKPGHVVRLHELGVDSITTNRVGDFPSLH